MAKRKTEPAVLEAEVDLAVQVDGWPIEVVEISRLKPHPLNYKQHPPEQIEHIAESIKEHGVYRNIVVATDYTILAGHGVVEALKRLGRAEVPVLRVPLEPHHPRALKLLATDNEVSRLGVVDDKALASILHTIQAEDEAGLFGTGYDDQALEHLIAVSGFQGQEVDGPLENEWVGMPAYENEDSFGAVASIKVHFATEEDLARFAEMVEQNLNVKTKTIWYPKQENEDLKAVRYVEDIEDAGIGEVVENQS